MMWMEFKCVTLFLTETPQTRQYFSALCVVALRVYWIRKILASFF